MDIEDISGAYKKYIRDLPAPLFTDDGDRTTEKLVSQVPDCMHPCLNSYSLIDPSLHEQLFLLKSIVSNLSVYRRALAFEFFYLLYLVSLRSDQVTDFSKYLFSSLEFHDCDQSCDHFWWND